MILALLENLERKGMVQGWLSSRQRDAPAGVSVEHFISHDLLHNTFHAHDLTGQLEGLRIAGGDACSGSFTAITMEDVYVVDEFVGGMRAHIYARTAAYAPLRRELQLRENTPPFGIVAPETAKGTSFEEHSRPDAWAIVDGKPLDVEYGSGPAHSIVPQKKQSFTGESLEQDTGSREKNQSQKR